VSFPPEFKPTKPYKGWPDMPIIRVCRLPIREIASMPKIALPGIVLTLVDQDIQEQGRIGSVMTNVRITRVQNTSLRHYLS
jgi:hypothetical protein